MEEAVRAVTVARGVDPRELALIAFGGAGPLHACAIADALGMRAVIVPPRAGVLSAVGMLCSPRRREVVRSFPARADDPSIETAADELARETAGLVGAGARVEIAYDCRYVGQSHELTVDDPSLFAAEHERRNGHARPGADVELVALRARATLSPPLDVGDLPDVERSKVRGPQVIAEPDCTVWLPDGWIAAPSALGAWVLERA
jgi:N-methylhydantoinase A/oxoprolinase/acetone carboxylase beta subunit